MAAMRYYGNLCYRPRIMAANLEDIYDRLYAYCSERDFAGHDPFDGLNSRLFQLTPLQFWSYGRFGWLQLVKRSRANLRRLLLVPPGENSKGLALFALAELARFRSTDDNAHRVEAAALVERILDSGITGASAAGRPTLAFGYNFDWQSRFFFAPAGTPAIVPTAFACRALIEAHRTFPDKKYVHRASEICEFILSELGRPVETDDELCFSYTPRDNSIIFNASLLAGECLAQVGAVTGNSQYLELAARTVRFAIRRQRADGAWAYGLGRNQDWVDNFHTAYVLLSLHRVSSVAPSVGKAAAEAISRGLDYWIKNFFLDDGAPKYYDNKIYPIDIHCAAVAIAAMCEMKQRDELLQPIATRVAAWTIGNMLDPLGYFYYQKRKTRVIKTPFMRWSQAWMAYALAVLIESTRRKDHGK